MKSMPGAIRRKQVPRMRRFEPLTLGICRSVKMTHKHLSTPFSLPLQRLWDKTGQQLFARQIKNTHCSGANQLSHQSKCYLVQSWSKQVKIVLIFCNEFDI